MDHKTQAAIRLSALVAYMQVNPGLPEADSRRMRAECRKLARHVAGIDE